MVAADARERKALVLEDAAPADCALENCARGYWTRGRSPSPGRGGTREAGAVLAGRGPSVRAKSPRPSLRPQLLRGRGAAGAWAAKDRGRRAREVRLPREGPRHPVGEGQGALRAPAQAS